MKHCTCVCVFSIFENKCGEAYGNYFPSFPIKTCGIHVGVDMKTDSQSPQSLPRGSARFPESALGLAKKDGPSGKQLLECAAGRLTVPAVLQVCFGKA